jgi:hypothetical protein
VDLGRGLACKGRCEDQVRALISLVDRSRAAGARSAVVIKRNISTLFVTATFTAVIGSFLLGWGVFRDFELFTTGLGTIFLIYGGLLLLRAWRTQKDDEPKAVASPPLLPPAA